MARSRAYTSGEGATGDEEAGHGGINNNHAIRVREARQGCSRRAP